MLSLRVFQIRKYTSCTCKQRHTMKFNNFSWIFLMRRRWYTNCANCKLGKSINAYKPMNASRWAWATWFFHQKRKKMSVSHAAAITACASFPDQHLCSGWCCWYLEIKGVIAKVEVSSLKWNSSRFTRASKSNTAWVSPSTQFDFFPDVWVMLRIKLIHFCRNCSTPNTWPSTYSSV